MVEWPILVAAGYGLAELWRSPAPGERVGDRGMESGSAGMSGPDGMEDTFSDGSEFFGWRYPMASWEGYQPEISDKWSPEITAKHREHHGVDIMFRRKVGGADSRFSSGTSQGTPHYFCPSGVEILAPRDGYIWSSGMGPTGNYVVLSTRKPIAIFMVHMAALYVPTGIVRGAGQHKVKAGQPIGVVGFSPRDPQRLNHLHLEVWRGGGAASHVDPTPYLKGATR
jgi:murein DD-endopeptidase MepM/ murein hydrolase activator NlpD